MCVCTFRPGVSFLKPIQTHPTPPPKTHPQEWSTKEHFKVKTTAASLAQSASQKENKYFKAYRARAVAKGGNGGGDKARRVSEQVGFFNVCLGDNIYMYDMDLSTYLVYHNT